MDFNSQIKTNNSLFTNTANGRCRDDCRIGKTTTIYDSTIDYILLSDSVFPKISQFVVKDFDPILSDAHCAIKFGYTCSFRADAQLDNPSNGNET